MHLPITQTILIKFRSSNILNKQQSKDTFDKRSSLSSYNLESILLRTAQYRCDIKIGFYSSGVLFKIDRYQMKLQRFVESYRRQVISSPSGSEIFRTSESIGTLNSRDQTATDRSFVIKQIPVNTKQATPYNKGNQSVEHLRELCATEEYLHHAKTAEKGIPFASVEEINDELYQEAPTPNTQSKGYDLVSHEEKAFFVCYQSLLQRMDKLQRNNLHLQQQWLRQQQALLLFQRGCHMAEQQVSLLRQRVTDTIQQNIQIENMIKELLLKQQMQSYGKKKADFI